MRGLVAIAALLLLSALAAKAQMGDGGRYNPFEEPPTEAVSPGPAAPSPEQSWVPVLRATLVSGDASMANLGGTVLRIGESVRGHTLLRVFPFSAIFDVNGREVELAVEYGTTEGSDS